MPGQTPRAMLRALILLSSRRARSRQQANDADVLEEGEVGGRKAGRCERTAHLVLLKNTYCASHEDIHLYAPHLFVGSLAGKDRKVKHNVYKTSDATPLASSPQANSNKIIKLMRLRVLTVNGLGIPKNLGGVSTVLIDLHIMASQ